MSSMRLGSTLLVLSALLLLATSVFGKGKPTRESKSADKAKPAAAATPPTVAVLYFEIHAPKDEGLGVLAKGLAQMLIADLADAPALRLVERDRLEAVLGEQKLQQSKSLDRKTAVRVGKLLGARYLVLGSVVKLGAMVRMNARIVAVETGEIVTAVSQNGADGDFFGIEGGLVEKLRAKLVEGLPPAPKQAARPARPKRKRPKKLSTEAARQYAEALDAKDRGKTDEAKAKMQKVVERAPNFELAYLDLQSMTR